MAFSNIRKFKRFKLLKWLNFLSFRSTEEKLRPLTAPFKRNKAQGAKEGKESAFFTPLRGQVIFLSTPF